MRGGIQGIQWGEELGGTHTGPPVWVHIPAQPHARWTLDKSRCASRCPSWRRNDPSTCCYEDKEGSHLLMVMLPFKAQVHPSHTPSKKPV